MNHITIRNVSFCVYYILQITPSYGNYGYKKKYAYVDWITGTNTLPTANSEMATCTGHNNDTIYLLGGSNQNYSTLTSLHSFKNDIFYDLGYPLTLNTFGASQYWTQLDHTLWMISGMGTHINKFDTETLQFTKEYSQIPDVGSREGCLLSIESTNIRYLIATGGYTCPNACYSLNTVHILNLNTLQWVSTAAMNVGRKVHSCAIHQGLVYVLGGAGNMSYDYLDSIEMASWDDLSAETPVSTAWDTLSAKLLDAVGLTRAIVHLDDILVLAGTDGYGDHTRISALDTVTHTVRDVGNLNYEVMSPGVIVFNGILYVFGGRGYTDQYQYVMLPTSNSLESTLNPQSITQGTMSDNGTLYPLEGTKTSNNSRNPYKSTEMYMQSTVIEYGESLPPLETPETSNINITLFFSSLLSGVVSTDSVKHNGNVMFVIFGCVLGTLLVIFVAFKCYKKHKKQQLKKTTETLVIVALSLQQQECNVNGSVSVDINKVIGPKPTPSNALNIESENNNNDIESKSDADDEIAADNIAIDDKKMENSASSDLYIAQNEVNDVSTGFTPSVDKNVNDPFHGMFIPDLLKTKLMKQGVESAKDLKELFPTHDTLNELLTEFDPHKEIKIVQRRRFIQSVLRYDSEKGEEDAMEGFVEKDEEGKQNDSNNELYDTAKEKATATSDFHNV